MATLRPPPDLRYGTLSPRSQPRPIRDVCCVCDLPLCARVCVFGLYFIVGDQGNISCRYTAGQEELFPQFLFHVQP